MQFEPMNIRILLSTRKYLIFSVGVGLLGFVLVMALLIPQGQESLATYSKLREEQPKTESLRKKLASLESLTATAEYAQIEVVESALPSRKPLLELLMSLSTVSEQTGARMLKFELTPGLVATDSADLERVSRSGSSSYDLLSVDLEISGTFDQIQAFLLQVEQVSPFTTVSQMEITGEVVDASLRESNQEFRAKLTTQTFFFTQQLAVRVESPLPVIGTPEQNVLAALSAFVPTDLPEQTEVTGGGLDDLFGINQVESAEELESLLLQRNALPLATPSTTGSTTEPATPTDETDTTGDTDESPPPVGTP